jgi:hypothetical protein
MMGWWDALLAASDRNRDDKVTLDEVLLVVDRLPAMLEAVTATADTMCSRPLTRTPTAELTLRNTGD